PLVAGDVRARAAARAGSVPRGDAEHRGGARGGPRAAPGRRHGAQHRGRGTGDPRGSGAAGSDAVGVAGGAGAPRARGCGRPRRRHSGGDDAAGASMNTYRRMLHYLRPYVWPHGILAVAFMLVFSSIESSVPFLIKFTIDNLSMQQPGMLPLLAGLSFCLSLMPCLLGFVARDPNAWVGPRLL